MPLFHSYSHGYSLAAGANNERKMFLAQVLVGRSALGTPGLAIPPLVDENNKRLGKVNSLVDNVNEPTIFVVQEGSQAYPSHVITYCQRPQSAWT